MDDETKPAGDDAGDAGSQTKKTGGKKAAKPAGDDAGDAGDAAELPPIVAVKATESFSFPHGAVLVHFRAGERHLVDRELLAALKGAGKTFDEVK